MKILLGVIEDTRKALSISTQLFESMTAGDVKKARDCEAELLQTVGLNSLIYVSEDIWLSMLKKMREISPKFEANYVLSDDDILFLFENKLLLPEAIAHLVCNAVGQKKTILQLPMDEVCSE